MESEGSGFVSRYESDDVDNFYFLMPPAPSGGERNEKEATYYFLIIVVALVVAEWSPEGNRLIVRAVVSDTCNNFIMRLKLSENEANTMTCKVGAKLSSVYFEVVLFSRSFIKNRKKLFFKLLITGLTIYWVIDTYH